MWSMVTFFFSFIQDIACVKDGSVKDSCKCSEIDFTKYCWLWLIMHLIIWSLQFSAETVAITFSVSKLAMLVLIGTCMTYFIHLHHVTSRYVWRVTLLGQLLGETILRRFWAVCWISFIQHLCIRRKEGSLYNSLTFSGEAQGFDGLSVTRLLQILKQCDLNDYTTSALSRSGEMMSIQRLRAKQCNRLSKLLRKHADVNPICHSDHMTPYE